MMTMSPDRFPIPVDQDGNEWQASRETVWNDTPTVAKEFALEPYGLWALFMAESGEDVQSQERWYIHTAVARQAIANRDSSTLLTILQKIASANTNDISFGVGHRAYYWSKIYPGDRKLGDPYRYDLEAILNARKVYLQDHGFAMRDAAETLAANLKKTNGNYNEALYLYNKPDGTASVNVKANYDDKLAKSKALWGIPSVVPVPPVFVEGSVTFESYVSTPVDNFIDVPRGCILHGSRSGRASNPLEAEYTGTANWALNNPGGLGWNATIGHYKVALHLSPSSWGWNARAASKRYLAVEFAQPVEESNLTRGQVEAFCQWWVSYACKRWPSIQDYFPTHAEVERSGETGQLDGKTDVFSFGSPKADELRSQIMNRLNELRHGTSVVPPVSQPVIISVPQDNWNRMVNGLGYIRGDLVDRLSRNALPAPAQSAIALNPATLDAHRSEDAAIAQEIRRAATEAMS